MAHLIRMPRAAWRRQPSGPVEIDWNNPLCRGLRRAALFNRQHKYDYAEKTEITYTNMSDALYTKALPDGNDVGLYNQYLSQYITIPTWTNTTDQGSLVIAQKGISNNCTWLVSNGTYTDHFPYSDGKIYTDIFFNSRWCNGVTISGSIDIYKKHTIAVSVKNGAQLMYGNGNSLHENTLASGFSALNGITFLSSFFGVIYSVFLFDRALSKGECSSLSNNPYQIFKPIPARFILIPGTGGGSTVTVVAAIDALIQKTGIAQTLSLDALLQKSANATVSMDSLLAAAKTGLISFDALLQLARNTSVSIDALLLAVKSGTVSVDTLILAAQTAGTSIDAILTGSSTPTQTAALDALILASRTAGTSVDTLLLSEKTVSASLDTLIGIVGTRTLSLDALLQAMKSGIISLDAVLQMASGVSVSLDALLQSGKTGSISVDAVLVLASGASATLDAYIQASLSRGASLDAIIGAIAAAILPAGRVVGIDPSDRWITLSPSGRIVIT